jgi:hypothetical protein
MGAAGFFVVIIAGMVAGAVVGARLDRDPPNWGDTHFVGGCMGALLGAVIVIAIAVVVFGATFK